MLTANGQFTLKQLRLSLVNEMPTNSYTGPRLNIISAMPSSEAFFRFFLRVISSLNSWYVLSEKDFASSRYLLN